MADREALMQLERLIAIARADRTKASTDLANDRAASAAATRAEANAQIELNIAHRDWRGLLEATGFAPEQGRAFAQRMLSEDAALQSAVQASGAATQRCEGSLSRWKDCEARVQAREAVLRKLRRRIRRRQEERHLAILDETTVRTWFNR